MASTIQVDKIQDTGGNTILSSNSTGTFTNNLPANLTGATGTLAIAQGGTGAATLAAAGLSNVPAFYIFLSANQTISTGTWTKLTLDSELYDTDSAFASNKFTVPAGQAGKYFFSFGGGTSSLTNSTTAAMRIYKNGSAMDNSFVRSYPNSSTGAYPHKSVIYDLAVSDYIELYGQHTYGSDRDFVGDSTGTASYTFLSGQKLIGV